MIIHQKTPAHKTPRRHETPMIHPWLRHTSFDTKFWDSIKLMNPCVFCWSQYLRVLILSCLSCSIIVIMIVTSMQTDRQSIYGVYHEWLNGAIHGLWGIAAHHERHIRPHGNFMLYGVYPIVSYGLHESIINEWWIINLQSSIISPLIAMSELFSSRISSTVTYRGV